MISKKQEVNGQGNVWANMCFYTTRVLESYCQIIVLSVRATVGSAHGVSDYSVVTQRMVVV